MLVRLSFTPEVLLAYSAVQAGSLPMVQLEVPPHVRNMAAFEAHMRQKVRFQVKKGIVFLDGDFEVPKEAGTMAVKDGSIIVVADAQKMYQEWDIANGVAQVLQVAGVPNKATVGNAGASKGGAQQQQQQQ